MRHAIIWSAIVSVIVTNTSCRKQTSAVARSPQSTAQTYTMSDGLQITPLEVEPDELADILGIQRWRFRVVAPSARDRIHHAIELRDPEGSGTKITNSSQWSGDGADREMVVALYPLAGEFTAADKVKTYVRIGGGTTSGIRDNPFKGLGGHSRSPSAVGQEDGSFLLMEFIRHSPHPDPNNPRLFLTIRVDGTEGRHP